MSTKQTMHNKLNFSKPWTIAKDKQSKKALTFQTFKLNCGYSLWRPIQLHLIIKSLLACLFDTFTKGHRYLWYVALKFISPRPQLGILTRRWSTAESLRIKSTTSRTWISESQTWSVTCMVIKGDMSLFVHLEKFGLNFSSLLFVFKSVVIFLILSPLWFLIISLFFVSV